MCVFLGVFAIFAYIFLFHPAHKIPHYIIVSSIISQFIFIFFIVRRFAFFSVSAFPPSFPPPGWRPYRALRTFQAHARGATSCLWGAVAGFAADAVDVADGVGAAADAAVFVDLVEVRRCAHFVFPYCFHFLKTRAGFASRLIGAAFLISGPYRPGSHGRGGKSFGQSWLAKLSRGGATHHASKT